MEVTLPKKDGMPAGARTLRVVRSGDATGIGLESGREADSAARLRELEFENRQLQLTVRRLKQLAFLDGLTGLANRRHFNLVLRSELRRARREGAPLALILCDIDHFKRVNDALGHQAGDEVLRVLAQLLSRACRRGGDLAARYGGEEFALLLPGVNVGEAPEIARRLCREIEAMTILCGRPARPIRISASLGVSVLEGDLVCSPCNLVGAADGALYDAKRSGRNCVRFSPPHPRRSE